MKSGYFSTAFFIVLPVAYSPLSAAIDPADPIVTAGLASWRKADVNGIRCVDCHTPQPYDIAQFNFTLADVRLATTPHLPQADADAIFAFIEKLRVEYPPAGGLKNFRTYRPLQPGGGEIMGGENAPADVRDAAFGFYLQQRFKLAQSRINTLAEARAAADELIGVDVASIPVGIKFNLWSRSVLREGAVAGGELAEWLPSTGLQPKPEFVSAWFALQDAYIADPSTENMWAIYQASGGMLALDPHNFVPGETHPNWQWIIRGQFRANLLFTHDELLKARGLPSLLGNEDGVRPFRSVRGTVTADLAPFWGVGDNARVVQNRGFEKMPRRNRESVHNDTSYNSNLAEVNGWQIRDFRLSWFWSGWMMDNSLRFSGEGSTLSGEYMIESLWSGEVDDPRNGESDSTHGYRMHQVFFNAVHQYKLGYKTGAWRDNTTQPQHFEASKGYYLGYDRWRTKGNPPDIGLPGANALYKRMLANHLRMNILIHTDEALKLGGSYYQENFTLADLPLWQEALAWADPEWIENDKALLAGLKASLDPPLGSADTGDDDHDGKSNLIETALGTTATDDGGYQIARNQAGLLQISFARASANHTYVIEASGDMADWKVIATNPGDIGGMVTVSDPGSQGQPRYFLRMRVIKTAYPGG